MVFSSIVFLLYFLPAFLITYFFTPKALKNFVLLIFSIVFYSWGAPKFIFVILGTTLLDFYLVRLMDGMETRSKRRWLLTASVGVNLGLLLYFKYSNFFVETLSDISHFCGGGTISWMKLVLPIGISFYTFESITYVVDVYRRVHKPLKNFWEYQLYIILFPKLIAGPIVRYHDLADQITDREENENMENRLTGFYRFILGLSKKVLIANQVGAFADSLFAVNYADLDAIGAWLAIIAYTFQIYFDFSGYSDMAIGLAKMFGFRFPENFNNPYISQSITEFWRRWHMTLGSWMRNYLYIPLGGNRVSTGRLYFNLWIVFLASGLWHGASWNFIIWGAYHGTFLVLERAFLLKVYEKIGKLFRILLNFAIVAVGWVFFRLEHFSDAVHFIKRMFSFEYSPVYRPDKEAVVYLVIAAFFAFFAVFSKTEYFQAKIYFARYTDGRHIAMTCCSILLFVLCLSSITSSGFNPFIYFRF